MLQQMDAASLGIRLNELKSKFDKAMREGENFATLKEIYFQIKELECHLMALDWDPHAHANTSRRSSSKEKGYRGLGASTNRQRYVPEPPPLL